MSAREYEQKQQGLLAALQQGASLLTSIIQQHEDGQCELEVMSMEAKENGGRGRSLIRPAANKSSPLFLRVLDNQGEDLSDALRQANTLLGKLQERLTDRTSRILVTGDVNGGKSTMVNALLRAPGLLPVDQQPCTQAFCEIIPMSMSMPMTVPLATDNGEKMEGGSAALGKELVVHAIRDIDRYDPADARTYRLVTLPEMQRAIQGEEEEFQWYRLGYPATRGLASQLQSLSLSLIDSPGLNSDLFKTLAVFSKQEEIDVILFLINAANHLTLSAREFLERAGREKTMVFFCVNRLDDIRNQEKCRKAILAQIQEVSPASVEAGLVHFISAGRFLKELEEGVEADHDSDPASPRSVEMNSIAPIATGYRESFLACEQALIAFLVNKRVESKLRPAHHYLTQLAADLTGLFEQKQQLLGGRLSRLQMELDLITPGYQQLLMHQAPLAAELEQIEGAGREALHAEWEAEQGESWRQADLYLREVPWPGWWGLSLGGGGWRAQLEAELEGLAGQLQARAWARGLQMALRECRQMALGGQQHAAQLVGHGLTETAIKRALEERHRQTASFKLQHLNSLLDWSSLSIRSWMGAVSAGVGLWGWQAVGGMLVEVIRMVSGIRSRRAIGLLCVTLLAGGMGALLAQDLEEGGRARLRLHYAAEWKRLGATLGCDLEATVASLLAQQRSLLLTRFEEALHQQRLARAEKETQLGQQQATLERLAGHWQGLRLLQQQLQTF